MFGSLLIFDSLYLILCYITFDFFGALNSPFFAWLRAITTVARVLYFPSFAAALLCFDFGHKPQLRKVMVAGVLMQVAAGFMLYFSTASRVIFGWTLLYGPNIQKPLGNINTYVEAVACLTPLIWISAIQLATTRREVIRRPLHNSINLTSFLLAGATAALLYSASVAVRLKEAGQPLQTGAGLFDIAAHLSIFLALFVALQWIHLISLKFRNAFMVQFILRRVLFTVVLAVAIRKVIFALLAFNDHLSDWYAALFAFVIVLFSSVLSLKKIERMPAARDQSAETQSAGASMARLWLTPIAILGFFYIVAVKLIPIDWEHILGCVAAAIVWTLLLGYFRKLRPWPVVHRRLTLVLLTITGAVAFTSVKAVCSQEKWQEPLERYANYDASFFLIHQGLKPAVLDEKYVAWYQFLTQHAGIRAAVETPEVPLVSELKPTSLKKPNIIILVIDALRRDYVSAYNPAVHFTPAMQSFAQDSVVFQHAYTSYAGTALSDAAIWSGFRQLNKIFSQPVSRLNNLQPMLNTDGYHMYMSYNPIIATLVTESSVTGLSTDLANRQQKEFGSVVRELEDDLLKRKDPEHPFFAFSQPANVHTLSLTWRHGEVNVRPHPGFDDGYASAVENVDSIFGGFVDFLKKQGLYENTVLILTADHGESLGEMGRESHVSNLTPEVIQIPLIIHVPENLKAQLHWKADEMATLHDITPTLYYLLGHKPLNSGEMIGHPLFTTTEAELAHKLPDHYFLMSSYMPVFGILSQDQKKLFFVDATLHKSYYFELDSDPKALLNKVSVPMLEFYQPLIKQDLEKIDEFYNLKEESLDQ